MIVKLTARDGVPIYLNTKSVIVAERSPQGGYLVTIDAQVLAPIGSSGWSTNATTSRVLDLDGPGAKPLIDHLDDCVKNRTNP